MNEKGTDLRFEWMGCLGCVGTVCGCIVMIAATVKLLQVWW